MEVDFVAAKVSRVHSPRFVDSTRALCKIVSSCPASMLGGNDAGLPELFSVLMEKTRWNGKARS